MGKWKKGTNRTKNKPRFRAQKVAKGGEKANTSEDSKDHFAIPQTLTPGHPEAVYPYASGARGMLTN